MFDLNTIITALNTALDNAVAKALVPITNQLACIEEDVAAMKTRGPSADRNEINALTADLESFKRQLKLSSFNEEQRDEIMRIARAAAEQSMEQHTEEYSHDDYDAASSRLDEYDLDDFVTSDDVERRVSDAVDDFDFSEVINDALSNRSFSITFNS